MVAYFIRRKGNACAVISLLADNRQEVVQDGLSPIEAEILCAAKMADIPRTASQRTAVPSKAETESTAGRMDRQVALKF